MEDELGVSIHPAFDCQTVKSRLSDGEGSVKSSEFAGKNGVDCTAVEAVLRYDGAERSNRRRGVEREAAESFRLDGSHNRYP